MRTAIVTAMICLAALPMAASAQSSAGASVLDTGIPPNAIDRATAVSDQRRASQAQSAAVDRLEAERAARAASSRTGPVAGSTLSDGVSGLGTRPDVSPASGALAPK